MRKLILTTMAIATLISSCQKDETTNNDTTTTTEVLYTMPDEAAPHEGTWLQWPHHYEYGVAYRNSLDATWVAMTKALVQGEKVHIIAYSTTEQSRITALLTADLVSLTNVDFKIYQTNDVWVRDNGPIYVKDKNGNLVIEDWGFNGWGNKFGFAKCNTIPQKIATDQGKIIVDLNSVLTVEGGSVELDGNGTFMATKSSILNNNRNPNVTQAQAESFFNKYLGATKFIWLNGVAGLETTDMHIDGFAKFANGNTIVTMPNNDLLQYDVPQADINTLLAAKNKNGVAYNFVKIPLTQNNVFTTSGTNLGIKGSYINYYIANTKILVPNYNDPNDAVANAQIQALYPTKTVVGIDVRNLYENGGMVHCVTQQQPL
jgi:agmatine deiminase